jgi:hypothetical protein
LCSKQVSAFRKKNINILYSNFFTNVCQYLYYLYKLLAISLRIIYFDLVLALPLSTTKTEFLSNFSIYELNKSPSMQSSWNILHLGVTVTWIGQLVADLLLQRPRFDSKLVCVSFVGHRVVLGQVVSLSTFIFSCQCYLTTAPRSDRIYLSPKLYCCSIWQRS